MTGLRHRGEAPSGPLVIGGLGGSGTRVVAMLAIELGFDLGNDLNPKLDDRWFNLLFYRPEWLRRRIDAGSSDVGVGLDLMRKRAFGTPALWPADIGFIAGAWRDVSRRTELSGHPSVWAAGRVRRYLRSRPFSSTASGWGWKEPISHLIAPDLLRQFDDARYIHVIRHGLDMAHSSNRRQMGKFGRVFGITIPKGRRANPQERVRFWIRANRRIIDGICTSIPARTHVVRFDDLCAAPEHEIARLVQFLGIDVSAGQRRKLAGLVKPPESIGRYRSADLAGFDAADLQAVADLGFSVRGTPSLRPADTQSVATLSRES